MVFDWFIQASRSWTSSAQLLDLPMISVMPPDYQVLEVRHEPFRKAFAFLVQSESFDEVSSGDEIPGMIAMTRYETVEIRQPRYPNIVPSTADLDMRDRFGHPLVYDHSKPGVPVESIEWPTIGRFGASDLIAGMKHAIALAEEDCDKPLILK